MIYGKEKQIIVLKENGKLDALVIRLNIRSLLRKKKHERAKEDNLVTSRALKR